jgi:hypothetical protein
MAKDKKPASKSVEAAEPVTVEAAIEAITHGKPALNKPDEKPVEVKPSVKAAVVKPVVPKPVPPRPARDKRCTESVQNLQGGITHITAVGATIEEARAKLAGIKAEMVAKKQIKG